MVARSDDRDHPPIFGSLVYPVAEEIRTSADLARSGMVRAALSVSGDFLRINITRPGYPAPPSSWLYVSSLTVAVKSEAEDDEEDHSEAEEEYPE